MIIINLLFSVILISKYHNVLLEYETIIQNLSGSTALCFLEENSNLKLHSIVDVVGDHTEIHLLLKVWLAIIINILFYILYRFLLITKKLN